MVKIKLDHTYKCDNAPNFPKHAYSLPVVYDVKLYHITVSCISIKMNIFSTLQHLNHSFC